MSEPEVQYRTAWGDFELRRYPLQKHDKLRAWDAADEYLLSQVEAMSLLPLGEVSNALSILIFDDQFGALSLPLHRYQPKIITDSYVAGNSIACNVHTNGLAESSEIIDPLNLPQAPIDILLYKIPKNLAYLEDFLCRIRPLLRENAIVIGAGMVKHMPAKALQIAESCIGSTHTSLARKKARLVFSKVDAPVVSSVAKQSCYVLDDVGFEIKSFANVFSARQLDIGTRAFLPLIPDNLKGRVVDLACGSGVIGVVAAARNPDIELVFCDDSAMAVASAKLNFQSIFNARKANFLQTDCLQGLESDSVDTVLCNPPFHQGTTVGDFIAKRMFKEAKRCLRANGKLMLVANRHLGYHAALKRLFGNCEIVFSNAKFVVLTATKQV